MGATRKVLNLKMGLRVVLKVFCWHSSGQIRLGLKLGGYSSIGLALVDWLMEPHSLWISVTIIFNEDAMVEKFRRANLIGCLVLDEVI